MCYCGNYTTCTGRLTSGAVAIRPVGFQSFRTPNVHGDSVYQCDAVAMSVAAAAAAAEWNATHATVGLTSHFVHVLSVDVDTVAI
jgi:hypothetical protein